MNRIGPCLLVLVVGMAGCGGGPAEVGQETPEWIVERATEGTVTNVRNVAGSMWGGKGVLVEELAIGVLEGADEYILGRVTSIAVTDDLVFVADAQPTSIKVFDRLTGEFVRRIGAEGEGPGEYGFISALRGGGDSLYVEDAGNRRISVFGIDGEYRHALRLEAGVVFGAGFVVTSEGRAYSQLLEFFGPDGQPLPNDERRWGFQEIGREGPIGDPFYAPPPDGSREEYAMMVNDRFRTSVPMTPGTPFALTTAPAIVQGFTAEYRFAIHFGDGRTVRVERYWEPVEMSAAERAHHRAATTANARRQVPDWEWSGPEVPTHKPAYASLIPDHGSRIMVVRYRPSVRGENCVERPTFVDLEDRPDLCWATRYTWDFFDHDGNYLGEVVRPDVRIVGMPYMRDDTFALAVDDDDGAVRVKIYRLERPANPQDS